MCISVIIYLLFFCVAGFAGDSFEFRGDKVLLQTVRDAQESSSGAFPRGRLVATARLEKFIPGDTGSEEVRVKLIWNGDLTFLEYDLTQQLQNIQQSGATELKRPIEQRGVRTAVTPNAIHFYDPVAGRAYIEPKERVSLQRILHLRPDQMWYCPHGRPETPWSDHLNPEKYRNEKQIFSIETGEGGEILVRRDYTFDLNGHPSTMNYTYVASMQVGGNIIRYERTPLTGAPEGIIDTQGVQGTFEWMPVDDGRYYVKSYSCRHYTENPDEPVVTYQMTVESFDPDYEIPSDQFSFAALKIAPGTIVEDRTGRSRVYRYGQESKTLKTEQLDRLADEQREHGFATPERQKSP